MTINKWNGIESICRAHLCTGNHVWLMVSGFDGNLLVARGQTRFFGWERRRSDHIMHSLVPSNEGGDVLVSYMRFLISSLALRMDPSLYLTALKLPLKSLALPIRTALRL